MSYDYSSGKILEGQDANNHSINSQPEHQVRFLQEQIQMAVYNYQSLLQLEKKNSADRSEFLLYLIQSTRTRQQEELDQLKNQLQTALAQKEEASSLEKQMESIGEGVDSIVEEGKKLKAQNQSLQRQFEEQEARERELDQEVESCQRQLQSYRQKIDEWERTKIRWNRRKKELLEMIADAERQVGAGAHEEVDQVEEPLKGLFNKYKGVRSN